MCKIGKEKRSVRIRKFPINAGLWILIFSFHRTTSSHTHNPPPCHSIAIPHHHTISRIWRRRSGLCTHGFSRGNLHTCSIRLRAYCRRRLVLQPGRSIHSHEKMLANDQGAINRPTLSCAMYRFSWMHVGTVGLLACAFRLSAVLSSYSRLSNECCFWIVKIAPPLKNR